MVAVPVPKAVLSGGDRCKVDFRLGAVSYFSLPDQQALSASGHSL
jgi:hypothetical protein